MSGSDEDWRVRRINEMFGELDISDEDVEDAEDVGQVGNITSKLNKVFRYLQSYYAPKQIQGLIMARKMLSRDTNPPIDSMIERGIIPMCVQLLPCVDDIYFSEEAAWVLAIIASGNSAQTRSVIDGGAVPELIDRLQSESFGTLEKVVWALANIAGDGPIARDIVINHGAIDKILPLVAEAVFKPLLRHLSWFMLNLCRHRPLPPFNEVKRLVPVLSSLLLSSDTKVLADACWALCYVTDDRDVYKIQAVLDAYALQRLIDLLAKDEVTVIVPALRCVGTIVSGTDEQTDAFIYFGGLPLLGKMLKHEKSSIVREAAWAVSNICAGSKTQVQAVINSGMFEQIRDILETGSAKVQKEAAWAVTNAARDGVQEQMSALVEEYQILVPFICLLDAEDSGIVNVVLKGLLHLFQLAWELDTVDILADVVENVGGFETLETLKNYENDEISSMANKIIHDFLEPLKTPNNLYQEDKYYFM